MTSPENDGNPLVAQINHQNRTVQALRERIIMLENEWLNQRVYAIELEETLTAERSHQVSDLISQMNEPSPEPAPEV